MPRFVFPIKQNDWKARNSAMPSLLRITTLAVVTLMLGGITADVWAASSSSRRSSSRARQRLATRYFNQYYNAAPGYSQYQYNTALPQYGGYRSMATPVPTRAPLPPVTGPVERYSELEYGQIVQMAVQAARQNAPAPPQTGPRPTIVTATASPDNPNEVSYPPVTITISDVLDRGIILLPTGEELRLRGITTPSQNDKHTVKRLYGREATQALKTILLNQQITIIFDEPLRDKSGRLLGSILLSNGADVNRWMLEQGYGYLNPADFANNVDYSDLTAAQNAGRDNRRGVWSSAN